MLIFFFLLQGCSSVNFVSPTYANIVEIPVPVKDDKEEDIYSTVHKVSQSRTIYTVNISFWNIQHSDCVFIWLVLQLKPFKSAYANIRTTAVQMEERNVYCGAYFTKVLLDKWVLISLYFILLYFS